MNSAGLCVCEISLFLILVQVAFAWHDKMFTVGQMIAKGFPRGIPLIAHWGIMVGDVVIVTSLLGMIWSRYSQAWSFQSAVIAGAVSSAVCVAAYLAYTGTIPEAQVYGGKRTMAGLVHLYYAIGALAVFILFYFATPHEMIEPSFAKLVSFLLIIHIFIGTHSALKIWNPPWFGIPFTVGGLVPTLAMAVPITTMMLVVIYRR